MRNTIFPLALLVIALSFLWLPAEAQAPQKMSFQAVVRNGSGYLVMNAPVGMRISILHDSMTGPALYVETQTPTTNANGLATMAIGEGTVISGVFANINWADGPYYLMTETDPSGGNNYSIAGVQQLMSVPYALYAASAGSVNNGYAHYIGELYGGGIIYYIYRENGQEHGLIASRADLAASSVWSNINSIIGTQARSSWDGLTNSNAIVSQLGHTTSAAKLCLDYSYTDATGTYDDWYLPAVEEMNLLTNCAFIIDKFLPNGNVGLNYWTSTEYVNNAYFSVINSASEVNKSQLYSVRAVRRF